jgi:hypothetical protein
MSLEISLAKKTLLAVSPFLVRGDHARTASGKTPVFVVSLLLVSDPHVLIGRWVSSPEPGVFLISGEDLEKESVIARSDVTLFSLS